MFMMIVSTVVNLNLGLVRHMYLSDNVAFFTDEVQLTGMHLIHDALVGPLRRLSETTSPSIQRE